MEVQSKGQGICPCFCIIIFKNSEGFQIQKGKLYEKQKKQYNDAIKAYDHTGNGVSWSQSEWKTYDTQMTVTFEDSVKVEGISKGMNVING